MSFSKPLSFSSLVQLFCVASTLLHSCAGSPHGNKHAGSHLVARQGITSGIKLENKTPKAQTFYFYQNDANDAGQGTTSSLPTLVNPGQTVTVQLPLTWKGHVQRSNLQPATWVEFQIQDTNAVNTYHPCHGAHGDVSLEQGYDGPATVASTDAAGTFYGGQWNGITTDILTHAPDNIKFTRKDGVKTLQTTLGNGAHPAPDVAAGDFEWNLPLDPADAASKNPILQEKLLRHATYVRGGTGVPDVGSCNNILQITFY